MSLERSLVAAAPRRSGAGAVSIAAITGFVAVAPIAPSWLSLLALLVLGAAIVVDVDWCSTQRPTAALLAFTGAGIVHAMATLLPFLSRPLTQRGVLLLVQFAAVPLIAAAFWLVPRGRAVVDAIRVGATAGVVATCAIALVQVVVLGGKRGDAYGGNSIVFGTLALLVTVVSLALLPRARPPEAGRRRVPGGAVVAALGLTAVVLSSSRSAWLSVPIVFSVLAFQYRDRLDRRRVVRWVASAAGVGLVLLPIGGNIVRGRASAAIAEIANYLEGGSASPAAGTSVGARFEAWRSAVDAFEAYPITGIGWGNLAALYEEQVAWGVRHPRIASFDHAHGLVLSSLANGGLIGAAASIALIAVPAIWFGRAVRSSDFDQRRIGYAGILVVVIYAIVGFTEALLENLTPLACYAVIVAALMSQLTVEPRRSIRDAPEERAASLGEPMTSATISGRARKSPAA